MDRVTACDCHAHVFDPARFPYASERAYTPPVATCAELIELHARLGVGRVVLVQPSVYGVDNRCMVDAVAQLGPKRARGIAVVNVETVSATELSRLNDCGVRGIRLNVHVSGGGLENARRQVLQSARALSLTGWSLQVHAAMDVHVALLDAYRRLERPVVLDHYAGGLQPDAASEEMLVQLLDELRRSDLYVKLSAPYRLWAGAGSRGISSLAQLFQSVAPDRVLWGSDWPHTGGSGRRNAQAADAVEAFRRVDDAQIRSELLACFPSEDARDRLLVRNPATLYGFDD